MSSSSQGVDQSEIRLMGLILMQSLNVGLAIGVFNAGIWIDLDSTPLNAFTYAMGAFFVQGIAYYFFKMFFQQGMDDKARQSEMERERRNRYRSMEMTFERRRQDMELRMQEAQLEQELRWMEQNPGKMPPMNLSDPISVDTTNFNPEASDKSLELGVSFDNGDNDIPRGPDGKFKRKE